MTDSLKTDQEFIRSCIRYEVLDKKPVFEAYKHFCKVIGGDVMEYKDFEFWFYRFYNGNHDLDFDRKLEPKTHSFSELSTDVIDLIVHKVDVRKRLVLRKVSRWLRTIIDKNIPLSKTIDFVCFSNYIHAGFYGHQVLYSHKSITEQSIETITKFYYYETCETVRCDDFMGSAIKDLAIALKNPKLQLDSFHIRLNHYEEDLEKKLYEDIISILKFSNHKISVKKFSIWAGKQQGLKEILPHFQSGVLESTESKDSEYGSSTGDSIRNEIDKLVQLDQWKQAKKLKISTSLSVSIETFFRFEFFDIKLNEISSEDLIRLRDEVLTSTEFKHCCIRSSKKPAHNFRRFIDNQTPPYNNISIYCESYNIQVNFNGHDVIYTDFETVDSLLKEEDDYRAVRAKNWRQAAFDDVTIPLRHPKLHLECFKIQYTTASGSRSEHDWTSGEKTANWIYKKLRTLLKSLKHKISVKNATLYAENQEQFLMVLPYLKPGVLEEIDLSDAGYPCEREHMPDMMNIDKIIKLDQWKHAKEIWTRYLLASISVDNFSHCNSFAVHLTEISFEDLARLRDAILNSDDLKYYHIKTERKLRIDNVTELFGDLSNAHGSNIHHYPIPNTDKILELDISSAQNFTIRTEKISIVGSR